MCIQAHPSAPNPRAGTTACVVELAKEKNPLLNPISKWLPFPVSSTTMLWNL